MSKRHDVVRNCGYAADWLFKCWACFRIWTQPNWYVNRNCPYCHAKDE